MFHLRTGNFKAALRYAQRCSAIAGTVEDSVAVALAHSVLGISLHLSGDLGGARVELEAVLWHAPRDQRTTTAFNIALAQGLAATGRFAEGVALIDDMIRLVEANGDGCYMPELLRVKGNLLLAMPQPRGDGAELCFVHSLEMSRRQGARAWELRTGVVLAAQGRGESARAFLQPVFEQFVEGSDTADLKAAGRLLATLVSSDSRRSRRRAAPKQAARSHRSKQAGTAAKS